MSEDECQETRLIDEALGKLGEHFDTVQIFCGKHDGEKRETFYTDQGFGDIYSRMAKVREWSIMQDERAKIYARQQEEEP